MEPWYFLSLLVQFEIVSAVEIVHVSPTCASSSTVRPRYEPLEFFRPLTCFIVCRLDVDRTTKSLRQGRRPLLWDRLVDARDGLATVLPGSIFWEVPKNPRGDLPLSGLLCARTLIYRKAPSPL